MAHSMVVPSSQHRGHSEQLLSAAAKLSMLGVTAAAVYSFYTHLRLLVSTWSPALEEDSESDRAGRLAEVQVANVFQKYSGVRVYHALRIPDTGHRGRREIDLVILTKRKLYVVEVKNWSGRVKLEADGTWCQIRNNGSVQKHPNIVEETRYRAGLLESYIARRGLTLPSSFLEYKVVLVNPECRADEAILSQPEVLSFDQWESFLAKEAKKGIFGWVKLMMPNKKKEVLADSLHQQLHFILSTAPTWDRLELEGGRTVLGDFLHFKGRAEDMEALKLVKRSHVSNMTMNHQRQWLFGILGIVVGMLPEVQVSCTVRDYRVNTWKKGNKDYPESTLQAKVRPDMQVVFRSVGTARAEQFKINNVVSMSLSA